MMLVLSSNVFSNLDIEIDTHKNIIVTITHILYLPITLYSTIWNQMVYPKMFPKKKK